MSARRSRPRRGVAGLTLAEVLVASSAFLVVMAIGIGAVRVVERAGQHLKNRSEPRQQLRTLVGHLQSDLRAASFVFNYHRPVLFGGGLGHDFQGAPMPWPEGEPVDSVLWARAESAEPETTFSVEGLFLQPYPLEKAPFSGARLAVLASAREVVSDSPGRPVDIPIDSLAGYTQQARRFEISAPPGGLKVWYSPTADGLVLQFALAHRNESGGLTEQSYRTQFTMRNNR